MKKIIYIGLGIIAALIAILYLIPAYYKKKGYKLIHHPEPAHYGGTGYVHVPAENDLTEITNKNLYTYAYRFWYIKIKKPNNWTIYDPYMCY